MKKNNSSCHRLLSLPCLTCLRSNLRLLTLWNVDINLGEFLGEGAESRSEEVGADQSHHLQFTGETYLSVGFAKSSVFINISSQDIFPYLFWKIFYFLIFLIGFLKIFLKILLFFSKHFNSTIFWTSTQSACRLTARWPAPAR